MYADARSTSWPAIASSSVSVAPHIANRKPPRSTNCLIFSATSFFKAVIVGIPALGGVVAGTALQQRVPERAVAGAFAVLLIASAVVLIV